MGTKGRWRAWLVGLAIILIGFGLAWWNNPVNIGAERESQRAWLALGFAAIGFFLFVPPLSFRPAGEYVAQRTLIVTLALFIALAVWWVGYLPADPGGCARVNDPDCHTNAITRWRALIEGVAVFGLAFLATHALGGLIERYRARDERNALGVKP